MTFSVCHGTKKRLQISVFQNIREAQFYDSVSCPMSDNENRFYKNDLPTERTSCLAYI